MQLLRDLIHLVFPDLCCACGNHLYKGEDVICTLCRVGLPYSDDFMNGENKVELLFRGRVQINGGASLLRFRKAGKVQRLLHELKYKGNKEVGRKLGNMFGSRLLEAPRFEPVDIILPVPLHPGKLKLRGYNQALVFAAGIAEVIHSEVRDDCLVRTKFTDTQTHKQRFERFQNVEDVFMLKSAEELLGRTILLVDDVITTGSTLESCAITILSGCGAKIYIGSIANAV